jgi:hypothetical protein
MEGQHWLPKKVGEERLMISRDQHGDRTDSGSFNENLARFRRRERSNMVGAALFGAIGVLGLAALGIPAGQYSDGWLKGQEEGRTKNSISAVVAGIVAEKAYGDATINLEVKRALWPDSHLSGEANRQGIDSTLELNWHPAHFTAQVGANGRIQGNVDKSEFDWTVTPITGNQWKIERFALKFDYVLTLNVSGGSICGQLERPGPAPDFQITGNYSPEGMVHITIDPSFGMGIELSGNITPQR